MIEAADFRRFAMVGTCWGGAIAVDYAARHPDQVSHLVLYGSYARGRLRRTGSPNEMKKSRVLADVTRLGWGQDDHDFVQVGVTIPTRWHTGTFVLLVRTDACCDLRRDRGPTP